MMFDSLQQTVAQTISCSGVGLHSGEQITLTIHPAPEHNGIRFIRSDVTGFDPIVSASHENVTETMLGTSIANDDGTMVCTIEHVMAALWGCGIDNADVELTGTEVPIMDGSAEPFVFLIECAGVKTQRAPRHIMQVLKPITVREGDKFASIQPDDHFSVDLAIDFDNPAIAKQHYQFASSRTSFRNEFCRARTFGFAEEVEHLRSIGLAQGGSLDNAIVIEQGKVLNKEGLRYRDEFVRHKILDCIGDLFVTGGAYIQGKVEAYRTGHYLNNLLLRQLFADATAWRMVPATVNVA